SNPGSNLPLSSTYIEVLSGDCATSFSSIACQNISSPLNLTTLSAGVTYFVRIFVTTSTSTSGNPNNRKFLICLQASPNNDCIGSISLTSSTTCTNTAGTLSLSTISSAIPA